MKKIHELLLLFLCGGMVYLAIEFVWRGYSHISMFVLGGLSFVLIGLINEHFSWDLSIWIQCLIGCIIITALEYVFGLVLNVWLGLGIWDYSNQPFNLQGQICLQFSLVWYILSGGAIFLDDVLRYALFDEDMPHYNFGLKSK